MTMRSIHPVALAALVLLALASPLHAQARNAGMPGAKAIPLKEAKLIIEHNATDRDTGFQGFIDGEGWKELTVVGPEGTVFEFEGTFVDQKGEGIVRHSAVVSEYEGNRGDGGVVNAHRKIVHTQLVG